MSADPGGRKKGFTMYRLVHGFTLVELLVVVTVIAVLSMIGTAVYGGVQASARDAKRRGDLQALVQALEQYKAKNGAYPVGTFFSVSDQECTWSANCPSTFSRALVDGGFIYALPLDPVNKQNQGGGSVNFLGDNAPIDLGYIYYSDPNGTGTSFILGTNLETKTAYPPDADDNYKQWGNHQVYNAP